jgi:hypothetical protein
MAMLPLQSQRTAVESDKPGQGRDVRGVQVVQSQVQTHVDCRNGNNGERACQNFSSIRQKRSPALPAPCSPGGSRPRLQKYRMAGEHSIWVPWRRPNHCVRNKTMADRVTAP